MARQGEIIDGKYEVLSEIGRGGMSIVYLAMDKRLNKQWAIKEFRKDKDDQSRKIALEALLKEANLMKKLDHPTLPRIVDIIDQDSTVYIVMDYIEGESLNKVLDVYGAQPQDAVIEWAKQLAEVLDYLHTRKPPVIYRDMKPANIMLKPDGTIRLIDFGIAREYKEGKDGDTTSIGTRGYAAPEQFGDKGQTDARTDIYSYGVTLYHLLTGKNPAEPPYELYPIRHWNPNLSSGLEWLIQKCTQLNPGDRFQSCAEILYVLNNLEKFEGAYKNKQKKKIRVFVLALICSLVFGIVGTAALFLKGADHSEQLERLKSEHTITGYIEAIKYDNSDADSYSRLIDLLDQQIDTIYPGENTSEDTEADHRNGVIYQGEIDKALTTDNLEKLKEKHPETYAYVNYSYGIKLWNCYSSSDKDSEKNKSATFDAINVAYPYFEKAVDIIQETGDSCGLTNNQVKTTEEYYLLGYFRKNENNLKADDKDEFRINGAVYNILSSWGEQKFEFRDLNKDDDSYALGNPYYAYWKLLVRTVDDLDKSEGSKALPSGVQMTTLYLNANTVIREKTYLITSGDTKYLPPEEIESFYNSAVKVYNDIKEEFYNESDSVVAKRRYQLSVNTGKSLVSLSDDLTNLYNKYGETLELDSVE